MKQFKRVGSAVRRSSSFLTPRLSSQTPSRELSETDLLSKTSPAQSVTSISQIAQSVDAKPDLTPSASITSPPQSRADSPDNRTTEQSSKSSPSLPPAEIPAQSQSTVVTVVEPVTKTAPSEPDVNRVQAPETASVLPEQTTAPSELPMIVSESEVKSREETETQQVQPTTSAVEINVSPPQPVIIDSVKEEPVPPQTEASDNSPLKQTTTPTAEVDVPPLQTIVENSLEQKPVPQVELNSSPSKVEEQAATVEPSIIDGVLEVQHDERSSINDDPYQEETERIIISENAPYRMSPQSSSEDLRRGKPLSPIEEDEDDSNSIVNSITDSIAAVTSTVAPSVVVDAPPKPNVVSDESNMPIQQTAMHDNISEISDDGTTPRGGVAFEQPQERIDDPQFRVPLELRQGKVTEGTDSYFVGIPVIISASQDEVHIQQSADPKFVPISKTVEQEITVPSIQEETATHKSVIQQIDSRPLPVTQNIEQEIIVPSIQDQVAAQKSAPIPIPQPANQEPVYSEAPGFPFITEDPFRDPDPPIVQETYAVSYQNASPSSSYRERRSIDTREFTPAPMAVPLPPLHEVTSNKVLRNIPSDFTLTAQSSRAPSVNRGEYNEHSPLLGGRGVNLENDVNAIWPAPVAEYTTLGWTEHVLPDMRTYYIYPRLSIITDADMRDKRKLKAVMKYINKELPEQMQSSPPDSWELWLRDIGNTRYGFAPVHNWVNHNSRTVSFDPPDRFGTENVGSTRDDKLDLEYRYWSFMETHPAHAPLPSHAHTDALDALTWSYTGHTYIDRILKSQDSTPLPFNPDECQRLMSVLQSLDSAQSSIQSLVHTRVVARILLRVAHWRQQHFRPEKALPHDTHNSVRDGYSWTSRRTMWDNIIAWLCFGLPYYFASRGGYTQYDEESGLRTVAPMLLFGASVCLVAAILLSASVTFLALPGLDNVARTAGFIAIMASAASLGSSLIAFYRQQAELQRWSVGGEGLIISTRGSVILSLPAVFLVWSILAFTTGVIFYAIRGATFIDSNIWTEHFAHYTWWTAVGVLCFCVGVLITSAFFLRR